jgi:hypothetical protein
MIKYLDSCHDHIRNFPVPELIIADNEIKIKADENELIPMKAVMSKLVSIHKG